jgi:nucleolar pre-ribosomal-associated protein 1
MEPRLSSRWLINIAWMGSVISLPIPKESFFISGVLSHNEYKPMPPPLSTILDNILPSQWPKPFISKGLQSNSSLVQRTTALCLAQVLEKYTTVLEHLKLAESTLEEEVDLGQWASRRKELEREMRKRVPNFEVVVALLQQKISSGDWGTNLESEPADRMLRNAMVIESALRVMWLYHHSLPDIPAEARYDVGRLLDSAVLKRFLFSLTKPDQDKTDENDENIPGFDAVSVLHILRLLEHNDQLTWHTNLGNYRYDSELPYTDFSYRRGWTNSSSPPPTTLCSTSPFDPVRTMRQSRQDCFQSECIIRS